MFDLESLLRGLALGSIFVHIYTMGKFLMYLLWAGRKRALKVLLESIGVGIAVIGLAVLSGAVSGDYTTRPKISRDISHYSMSSCGETWNISPKKIVIKGPLPYGLSEEEVRIIVDDIVGNWSDKLKIIFVPEMSGSFGEYYNGQVVVYGRQNYARGAVYTLAHELDHAKWKAEGRRWSSSSTYYSSRPEEIRARINSSFFMSKRLPHLERCGVIRLD